MEFKGTNPLQCHVSPKQRAGLIKGFDSDSPASFPYNQGISGLYIYNIYIHIYIYVYIRPYFLQGKPWHLPALDSHVRNAIQGCLPIYHPDEVPEQDAAMAQGVRGWQGERM